MSNKRIIVAIDGPAGAGKSTLAKRIAQKLGFVYINTGSMYRAVALWALRTNTSLDDMYRLEQLAQAAQINLTEGGERVLLNGEDVTDQVRTPTVSDAASLVSAVPGVRRALVNTQRAIAAENSVVMEGRDIGTVVFPDAQVKIFLDADLQERARRRSLESSHSGSSQGELVTVEAEMSNRDERDRNRAEAPLMQAPDAQLVDTTDLTLDQVEATVLALVRAKTSNGKDISR